MHEPEAGQPATVKVMVSTDGMEAIAYLPGTPFAPLIAPTFINWPTFAVVNPCAVTATVMLVALLIVHDAPSAIRSASSTAKLLLAIRWLSIVWCRLISAPLNVTIERAKNSLFAVVPVVTTKLPDCETPMPAPSLRCVISGLSSAEALTRVKLADHVFCGVGRTTMPASDASAFVFFTRAGSVESSKPSVIL